MSVKATAAAAKSIAGKTDAKSKTPITGVKPPAIKTKTYEDDTETDTESEPELDDDHPLRAESKYKPLPYMPPEQLDDIRPRMAAVKRVRLLRALDDDGRLELSEAPKTGRPEELAKMEAEIRRRNPYNIGKFEMAIAGAQAVAERVQSAVLKAKAAKEAEAKAPHSESESSSDEPAKAVTEKKKKSVAPLDPEAAKLKEKHAAERREFRLKRAALAADAKAQRDAEREKKKEEEKAAKRRQLDERLAAARKAVEEDEKKAAAEKLAKEKEAAAAPIPSPVKEKKKEAVKAPASALVERHQESGDAVVLSERAKIASQKVADLKASKKKAIDEAEAKVDADIAEAQKEATALARAELHARVKAQEVVNAKIKADILAQYESEASAEKKKASASASGSAAAEKHIANSDEIRLICREGHETVNRDGLADLHRCLECDEFSLPTEWVCDHAVRIAADGQGPSFCAVCNAIMALFTSIDISGDRRAGFEAAAKRLSAKLEGAGLFSLVARYDDCFVTKLHLKSFKSRTAGSKRKRVAAPKPDAAVVPKPDVVIIDDDVECVSTDAQQGNAKRSRK